MVKAIKPILSLGAVIGAAISFVGCQGSMNTKAASSLTDTVVVDSSFVIDSTSVVKDTAVQKEKGYLTERWRNPVQVPVVDTLNPISKDSLARFVRLERRRVRDSVTQELDKLPKHVYFTFDDGPLIGSSAIDSISKAKNIKINAFLVGRHANMSKRLKKDLQRYKDNTLVECYNHSYTHAGNRFNTFYSNPVSAYEDFEKNELDLELKHKIVRLPGRNIWIYDDIRRIDLKSGASTADMLYTNGYKIYGWDVEWRIHSASGKPVQSVEEIYTRIRNYMNNKSSMEPNNVVLLMHDDMFQSKKGQQLLSSLIDTIQTTTDYKFEFISDYPFRY
ncbi:polysaccharide deacetylase family protein [Sphingobacterium micropteri]|nr:polysaccharide deacetylase family protein [Sphingobacterium micropteri]